jgi:lysophospholipase L1-like esterase
MQGLLLRRTAKMCLKYLAMVLTVVPILLMSIACNLKDDAKHIYTMGDSLTVGYPKGNYQTTLEQKLGVGWHITNVGKLANSTCDMRRRFEAEVISPGNAEYVIIWGGINDITDGRDDIDRACTKGDLQAMYNMAHVANIKVIAVSITPLKGHPLWSPVRQNAIEEINRWIMQCADRVDYAVDVYSLLNQDGSIKDEYDSGDHEHLNEAGYAVVGNAIHREVWWYCYIIDDISSLPDKFKLSVLYPSN